ncbi:MAG TPA: YciI family protein [Gemmatimonadaceae bacterium]|nr:YciI family protein [Gemmatimonadaceae bacterium]
MRYMTIYKSVESKAPPTQEHMDAMGKFIEEIAAAGVLVRTDGLLPSSRGARVRLTDDGKITVTDGPFAETKEVVGGYAIIDVATREEAIEWTKRFLKVAGAGESEIREMYVQPAFDADPTQPSQHNAASRQ